MVLGMWTGCSELAPSSVPYASLLQCPNLTEFPQDTSPFLSWGEFRVALDQGGAILLVRPHCCFMCISLKTSDDEYFSDSCWLSAYFLGRMHVFLRGTHGGTQKLLLASRRGGPNGMPNVS